MVAGSPVRLLQVPYDSGVSTPAWARGRWRWPARAPRNGFAAWDTRWRRRWSNRPHRLAGRMRDTALDLLSQLASTATPLLPEQP